MKYFFFDILLSFTLAVLFIDPRIVLLYFGFKLIGIFYLKYLIQGSDRKVIKIYNVVFIIFMSYLGLTHFVNINDPLTDYFYHNDQFVFYKDAIRIGLLDWNEFIDGSILNSRYGKYPLFSLFIGLLYKLGSFLQVTDLLLFFKMSVVLLGSLIPATISSILNLLNIRFKISSFIYLSLFSYILTQTVVFTRDLSVAFFYTFFVYLILAPKIKWRFLKLIIVMLIITGLRIEFGLFSIVFLLIFLTSKYRINKNFKYFIIFILAFAAFYFKVFDFFIDTFFVLREYYMDYTGSTTTSSNSLFLKMANLPFPFNFLFSFFYTVLMPLPIFSLVILEDDLTLLPSIINPFYLIFVLGVSIWSLFKNRRKYTVLDLLLIASFLCICLSSYVEPNVRRNFAVYPIIFLHYLAVKNNLSVTHKNNIFIFTLLFVFVINIFVYSYFIF